MSLSLPLQGHALRELVKEAKMKKALENAHQIMALHHALGKTDADRFECECCGKKNLMRVFAVNGHIVGSECKNHPGEFPCRRPKP